MINWLKLITHYVISNLNKVVLYHFRGSKMFIFEKYMGNWRLCVCRYYTTSGCFCTIVYENTRFSQKTAWKLKLSKYDIHKKIPKVHQHQKKRDSLNIFQFISSKMSNYEIEQKWLEIQLGSYKNKILEKQLIPPKHHTQQQQLQMLIEHNQYHQYKLYLIIHILIVSLIEFCERI